MMQKLQSDLTSRNRAFGGQQQQQKNWRTETKSSQGANTKAKGQSPAQPAAQKAQKRKQAAAQRSPGQQVSSAAKPQDISRKRKQSWGAGGVEYGEEPYLDSFRGQAVNKGQAAKRGQIYNRGQGLNRGQMVGSMGRGVASPMPAGPSIDYGHGLGMTSQGDSSGGAMSYMQQTQMNQQRIQGLQQQIQALKRGGGGGYLDDVQPLSGGRHR